jgi:hypothetical protein
MSLSGFFGAPEACALGRAKTAGRGRGSRAGSTDPRALSRPPEAAAVGADAVAARVGVGSAANAAVGGVLVSWAVTVGGMGSALPLVAIGKAALGDGGVAMTVETEGVAAAGAFGRSGRATSA